MISEVIIEKIRTSESKTQDQIKRFFEVVALNLPGLAEERGEFKGCYAVERLGQLVIEWQKPGKLRALAINLETFQTEFKTTSLLTGACQKNSVNLNIPRGWAELRDLLDDY
jgi:hypothetical protein